MSWIGATRGSESERPLLSVVDLDAAKNGGAILHLRGGRRGCDIYLAPRPTELLLILARAHAEDSDVEEELRGYRTAEEIAELMTMDPGHPETVKRRTVTRYVLRTRRQMRGAGDEWDGTDRYGSVSHGLIETGQHKRGYRIGSCGLDVAPIEAAVLETIRIHGSGALASPEHSPRRAQPLEPPWQPEARSLR